MNHEIQARIAAIHQALDETHDPDIGMIAPPCDRDLTSAHIPPAYEAFLRVANGAVCGVILLYESEDILKKQAPALGLPGGRTRWFCIGSVEEKALIMDVRTNAIHVLDPESERFDPDEAFGDLDYFLLSYVFGQGYDEFVLFADEDPWYQLL